MSKVLLITAIFPPIIGGPATFMEKLAQKLSATGHKVTVVCSSNEKTYVSDKTTGYKIKRVYGSNNLVFIVKSFFIVFTQMLIHRKIFVNGLEPQVYFCSKVLGRKYILKIVSDSAWEKSRNLGLTVESIDEFQKTENRNSLILRFIKNRFDITRRASLIITPSNYLKNMIVDWGIDKDKIKIVYNGVEINKESYSHPEKRTSNIFKILYVGRLTNWKGIETILFSVREIDNIQVSIIGDGPELPLLFGMARQLKLEEKVVFRGRLSKDDVFEEIRNSHALILVSIYEGLSHTLLEAMSMGLACIASNRGGNKEVIEHNKDGLLIEPHAIAVLKKSIEKLRDDEDFRLLLASNAQQKAQNFSFENTLKQTADIILNKIPPLQET